MTQVLPRGTRALLDWPVAFVFPCLDPEPLPPGTASLPQWRVAPPADDPSAEITYTPGLGGPFAGPRLLVTQRRMPTYLRDDPVRDGVQLYRWEPVEPMRTLTPTVRDAADAADARPPARTPVDRGRVGGVVGEDRYVPECARKNRDRPDRRTAAPHGSTTAPHRDRRSRREPSGPPTASDETPAPTRLIVQRGLFFGPSALVPEDLYSVVTRGGARRERHRVVLDPHSTVGTNTYWGRFHATYWQRWTAVGEVEVTARVSGTGRVRLMASDANKVWRIVAAEDVPMPTG